MKPFLMGSETEYAVSGQFADAPLKPGAVYCHLHDAIRRERLWLNDANASVGLYLENGGRFYLDSGEHPEYATPECLTPTQVACHDQAGERLLRLAANCAMEDLPGLSITILKNNLSSIAPDEITWGTHESYTCWIDPARAGAALLPHLASRVLYAGAGCLSAYAGCNGFELSQRSRHVVHPMGINTMGDRALFCTRVRGLKDRSGRRGWTRVHLISKDSQRAPFGTYLTYGVTGLLLLLLNAGRQVERGRELANPLQALRAFSSDPWLQVSVPLTDGRWLTALQIQESYLEDCEREMQKGGLPDWAGEVIHHWRETLEALARNPLSLANRLDPYCKLLIFDHALRRAGVTWTELHHALQDLALLRASHSSQVIQALLAEDPSGLKPEDKVVFDTLQWRFPASRLDRLRLAVRLTVLDLQYHELGGLYDRLAASGQFQLILSAREVDLATYEPPPGGRAAVRGKCVQSFQEDGWICEWRYLYHRPTGAFVDLLDPFGDRRDTGTLAGMMVAHSSDPEMQEIHAHLSKR